MQDQAGEARPVGNGLDAAEQQAETAAVLHAGFLSHEKRRLNRAGSILCLSDLLWIPQAGLIAWLMARFLPAAVGAPAPGVSPYAILIAVICFAALAVMRMYLSRYSARSARRLARDVKTRLRREILSAIAAVSPAADLPGSGKVAAHVGEQVEAIGPYLATFEPQKKRLTIVPIGILVATFCVSWLAGLILLITGPIIPVFMALIGIKAKAASQDQQQELTRMSGVLLDRLRGMETLRLFGALDRTQAEIASVGDRFRVGTMRVLKIAFLSSTVLELFSALGIAFVAVYVGFSLLGQVTSGTWGAPLSYAAGFFVLLLVPEILAPLRGYAAAYHDRAAGLAALEELGKLAETLRAAHDLQPVPAAATTAQATLFEDGSQTVSIEFDKVTVELAGKTILKEFSCRVGAGEHKLLVGPSGAGKTTLIDTLLGFQQPSSGAVLLSGNPLQEIEPEAWRQRIAWVGQSPNLFQGSLRANLRRANPLASDDEMFAALAKAGCQDLVARLPRGLSTPIGEGGFGFSMGERRRVALARAALRPDPLLFLADEPTAGLDPATAEDVIEGLLDLSKGRTLLIATHDPRLMARGLPRIEVVPRKESEPVPTAANDSADLSAEQRGQGGQA